MRLRLSHSSLIGGIVVTLWGFFTAFWAASAGGAPAISLECATNWVPKYGKMEFNLAVSSAYTNPYNPIEVEVSIRLETPKGATQTIPAFWYQPYERRRLGSRDWFYPAGLPTWKGRFAPVEVGLYKAEATLKDRDGSAVSRACTFNCVPSQRKGFLRVSTRDRRFLEFEEGQSFFPIGQNLAFIGDQQYVSLSKAEDIFGKLGKNGANFLRIWTCCEDWALAIEARKSAFGRSWDWHPQFVAMPGTENTGLSCLGLTPEKSVLRIDPSHPVALRPSTRYALTGQARLAAGTTLALELGGSQSVPLAIRGPDWGNFRLEFETKPNQFWLPAMTLRLQGQGDAWVRDLSLREAAGGPELLWEADVNRPARGYYNPLDCFMLDGLVTAAERNGIYLQLCLLTRDLYMGALKDPASPEYDRAIRDAMNTFRYAVARWGYSTSVAAWEYWNELDPKLPTDKFYSALGDYLQSIDPYNHLKTTSTWGPSAKDCLHPKLDIADVHFYLRPSDRGRLEDEVDAVLQRTHWLREQAPDKPVHLGEFGLANEKWQPRDEANRTPEVVDLHNALWASALSGASGTAMFWWWERLDQRNFYPQYLPLSRFLADVPWTGGQLQPLQCKCSDSLVRVIGLRTPDHAWLWLFNRQASWSKIVLEKQTASAVSNAQISLPNFAIGNYAIQWWDPHKGSVVRQETCEKKNASLLIVAPEFSRDLACRISPLKE